MRPVRTCGSAMPQLQILAGAWMKARKLLSNANFDPAALKPIGKAFDDAWDQVSPYVDSPVA